MKLAVVIPARDAADYLPDCLRSLSSQSHPADKVYLVVGPSSDETEAIGRGAEGPELIILENPAGDRASAINRALERTQADVVAMVDAQARLAPDYLERSLEALERTGAAVVGGPMRPEGRTAVGRAMAAALQSSFGIGDSQFHFSGTAAREVESVYLGIYRSSVFARVGRYNRALLRTEDDDLNWRIRDAGLAIWLEPTIRSTYLCRDSIGAIWRQFHGYGYWKVALATLRPGAIRWRHLVPALFVVGLIAAALASATLWWPALPVVLGVYLVAALIAALAAPGSGGVSSLLLFPIVTMTMHVAYGFGTLQGLASWNRLKGLVRKGPAA
jgi:succinoglycan biosynthesis protein ExoA